jgi:hypothetical protein
MDVPLRSRVHFLVRWFSLHSFGKDHTENTPSNNSPIVAWRLCCRQEMFTAPLPSNGWRIWLRGVFHCLRLCLLCHCLAMAASSIFHVKLHYKRPPLMGFVSNCQSCQGFSQNIPSINWSPLWSTWIIQSCSCQQTNTRSVDVKANAINKMIMTADTKITAHMQVLDFLLLICPSISWYSFCSSSNLSIVDTKRFLNLHTRFNACSVSGDILPEASCCVLVTREGVWADSTYKS